MGTYYIKGGSRYNEANPMVWTGLLLGGYDDSLYTESDWKAIDWDFNGSGEKVGQYDPYWRLGGDGGQQQTEIGLWEDYRIKYTTTGIFGYHAGSGEWYDMFLGMESGASQLSDLSDVGVVTYDTGKVLRADGVDYESAFLNWNDVANKPTEFTPIQHDNTYHSTNYEPEFSKNTAFNKNFGSIIDTVCEGNDSRLSDARTPTAHALAVSSGYHTGSLPLSDLGSYVRGSLMRGGATDWEALAKGTTNYVLKTGTTDIDWGQVDWGEITGKPSTFTPSAHASTHHSAGSDPITHNSLNISSSDHHTKTIDASELSAGVLANARVQQSNVTQHQAALSITESQISDLKTYLQNIVEDTTPQLGGNLDLNSKEFSSAGALNLKVSGDSTNYIIFTTQSTNFGNIPYINVSGGDLYFDGSGSITQSISVHRESIPFSFSLLGMNLDTTPSGRLKSTHNIWICPDSNISYGWKFYEETGIPKLLVTTSGGGAHGVIDGIGTPTSDYQVANKKYVDDSGGSGGALNDLTDVTITSVANDEVLAYDSGTSKWINQTAAEAGLATSSALSSHTGDAPMHNKRSNFAVIRDQKTNNVAGGTFTSGAWQTRALNKIVANSGSIVSLSSNRFKFSSTGYYRIRIKAPAYRVNQHQARLYNYTLSSSIDYGTSEYSGSGGSYTQSSSVLAFEFYVTNTSHYYEVQHKCQTSYSTNGFGVPNNQGWGEIYTIVEIWRIDA